MLVLKCMTTATACSLFFQLEPHKPLYDCVSTAQGGPGRRSHDQQIKLDVHNQWWVDAEGETGKLGSVVCSGEGSEVGEGRQSEKAVEHTLVGHFNACCANTTQQK